MNRRRLASCVLLGFAFLVFLLGSCRQTITLSVEGVVQDSLGNLMPNASLAFTAFKGLGFTSRPVRDYQIMANEKGRFRVTLDYSDGIGSYKLHASAAGPHQTYYLVNCSSARLSLVSSDCRVGYPSPAPLTTPFIVVSLK
jgi:hypothetical protein